jgi:phenylalanyl-tRNA synthetase beta chain
VENRYLRNSLIPGLLRVIAKAPSFDDIEIFELGHIFDKDKERESLAIITCGKSSRQVEKIIRNFAVQISIDPKLFKMYEISRDELKRFKIKKSTVYVAEVEVESLLKEAQFSDLDITDQFEAVQYRPISKFPPVSRDMAFIVDRKYNLDEIEREVIGSSDAVILVEPFDEFVNDRFGKDKKSVAFHVYLQNMGKTMLDQEAEIELRKIIKTLEQKFEAKIRS